MPVFQKRKIWGLTTFLVILGFCSKLSYFGIFQLHERDKQWSLANDDASSLKSSDQKIGKHDNKITGQQNAINL